MWLTAESCGDFRKRWEDKERLAPLYRSVERGWTWFSPPPPFLTLGFTRFLIGWGRAGGTLGL